MSGEKPDGPDTRPSAPDVDISAPDEGSGFQQGSVLERFMKMDEQTSTNFANFLQDSGVLPEVALMEFHKGAMGAMSENGELSVAKLKQWAASDTSPTNKWLAKAIVDRLDQYKIDRDGNGHISIAELERWSGTSAYLKYDPKNPSVRPEKYGGA